MKISSKRQKKYKYKIVGFLYIFFKGKFESGKIGRVYGVFCLKQTKHVFPTGFSERALKSCRTQNQCVPLASGLQSLDVISCGLKKKKKKSGFLEKKWPIPGLGQERNGSFWKA